MIEPKQFKNPFPGLRPFETDEYRLFFGREGQSDALINRLQRSRLLAVVGTSGSGKSSLVRAGLLPALRGGMMAGAGSGWRIAIMRPGSDPFNNLAGALVEKDVIPEAGGGLPPPEAKAVIEATLRRGSLGLVDAVTQSRLAQHEKLLIVVDQFEELFRFRAARATTSKGDDASAFVKVLLEAARHTGHSIYIILTMRSDFLGDCAQFPGLPEAINDGQYLIPRMTRDERRIAITGPIGVARGRMAEPLVSRLLNDVGDNPDQLPILQHALMRTWDYWAANRRDGEPLGLEHYQAIGTMDRALSVHADEAFEILDARSKRIAELMFKCLTERGADNREIRRPTRISEIRDIAGESFEAVCAVVEAFRYEGCSFLMPPVGVPLTPQTVIDISHESLIRNWDRLQKWVDEEAQSARIYRRLAEAAVLHREGREGLLQNPGLQIALDWRDQHEPNAGWARRYNPEFAEAMRFLDASKAAHEAKLAEEEREREEQLERDRRELEMTRVFAEKQARSARRMRWLAAGMAVLFLLSIVTAGYAFVTKRRVDSERARAVEALKQKEIAETERIKAEEKELFARAELAQALIKSLVAEDQARKEAERANTQAGIAAENFKKAEAARQEAVRNEKQILATVKRGMLQRQGTQSFRRRRFEEARRFFEQLRTELAALQPNALKGSANLASEQSRQHAEDYGWTLSNIGSTYVKESETVYADKEPFFKNAIDSYEKALIVLDQIRTEDSDDPILYDTYSGLAHSYHTVSNMPKAEPFFQRAVKFLEKHRPPSEAANGYLELAKIYQEARRFKEAEANFTRAIELRRAVNPSGNFKTNERAAIAAAYKELADLYQLAGRSDDAVKVLNEMVVLQEDVTVYELAEEGQAIAVGYSDLGQLYSARADQKQAENAYRTANMLLQAGMKLRRAQKDPNAQTVDDRKKLASDLDLLGDAYAALRKFPDAAAIYEVALDFRVDTDEVWISYEKLRKFYSDEMKNTSRAEDYGNRLIELFKDGRNIDRYVDAMIQLATLYGKDPNRYADAESLYKRALNLYSGVDDWQYPNLIHYRLGEVYLKQKKIPEREQAIMNRLELLTKYFNRLVTPGGPRPRSQITLVSEYLNAVEAAAFILEQQRRNDEAAAAYQPAFAAYDRITSTIYNLKVLRAYAQNLDKYQKLLGRLNKPTEAAKVAEKTVALQEKLREFDEVRKADTEPSYSTSQSAPGTH
ncbi:MAG TPA: hypothetical protein VJM12_00795 [Pyrinomonadaceae bacterium]|nr:hypothetical protein [Pyrinomonadaceae bacterium]